MAIRASDRALRIALVLWSRAARRDDRPAGEEIDPASDADLAAAMARGDESALASAYDRYGTLALAVALRACGDRSDAEEAVADGFLDLWRSAPRFVEDRGTLGSWLCAMVHNRAVDRVRRRKRRREDGGDPDDLRLATDGPDVAGAVDLRRALSSLRSEQREVLELAYFAGLTQREIASRLGVPLGTVKSLTWRALEALRTRSDLSR